MRPIPAVIIFATLLIVAAPTRTCRRCSAIGWSCSAAARCRCGERPIRGERACASPSQSEPQKRRPARTAADASRSAPLTAGGGGRELVVGGKNRVAFKDVLVGKVWLCSGQSNMAMTVAKSRGAGGRRAGQRSDPPVRRRATRGRDAAGGREGRVARLRARHRQALLRRHVLPRPPHRAVECVQYTVDAGSERTLTTSQRSPDCTVVRANATW